jgi:hypothetical protein
MVLFHLAGKRGNSAPVVYDDENRGGRDHYHALPRGTWPIPGSLYSYLDLPVWNRGKALSIDSADVCTIAQILHEGRLGPYRGVCRDHTNCSLCRLRLHRG